MRVMDFFFAFFFSSFQKSPPLDYDACSAACAAPHGKANIDATLQDLISNPSIDFVSYTERIVFIVSNIAMIRTDRRAPSGV
jgi:hypothetical protein